MTRLNFPAVAWITPFAVVGAFAFCSLTVAAAADADEGFSRLYNGKDLAGWEVLNGSIEAWQGDGELLSCIGEGGGWLRTKKMYSDYVLRLEFRIPADGNSGVGLRFPGEGNPAFAGMEVQVLDDDAEKYNSLKPGQYTGSIYSEVAAKRGHLKPVGEFNTLEITCNGPHVTVVLNGTKITEADLDEYKKANGDYAPLSERPQIGYVGFQSHGSRVDYRNVELKDLTRAVPDPDTQTEVRILDIKTGEGAVVPPGATVTVHYTGRLSNGKKFDSSRDRGESFTSPLSDVVKGWRLGIPGMKVGGHRKLVIPYQLAYGERGAGDVIPPKALLIFDVEVLDVK